MIIQYLRLSIVILSKFINVNLFNVHDVKMNKLPFISILNVKVRGRKHKNK